MADEIQARLKITETLNRYAWGYDTQDIELMGGTFASDGSFDVVLADHPGWGPYKGRKAIVEWLSEVMAGQTDQRRHCISNIVFREFEHTSAIVDSYLLLTAVENGNLRVVCTGTYHDKMVKVEAGWFIQHKTLRLDNPF